jgi:hypothetical protein
VRGAAVDKTKGHPAADDANLANQFMRHHAGTAEGHVIFDLAHAVVIQEPCDENGGVRPVELHAAEVLAGRGDAEATTLLIVEDGGKDARRIEAGQAELIDGAIHAHQRGRAQVADHSIVLHWLVAFSHVKVLRKELSMPLRCRKYYWHYRCASTFCSSGNVLMSIAQNDARITNSFVLAGWTRLERVNLLIRKHPIACITQEA